MASDYEPRALSEVDSDSRNYYLQKFKLYATRSRFYMIGRNKSRTLCRVLKIDRLEPTELNIHEDCTTYSKAECDDLLSRIHEGNKSTGGLKFVTTCYGIIGFITFLGPYYMLLITKRRQIGAIGGHAIYTITKSKMIPIPNPTVLSNIALSKNENRYKKLLSTVDLTKDFFFSYSYHVMHSLQKNLCDGGTRQVLYESMFVWNKFLTQRIRDHLKNTLWTVALVHGFFKQAKLSISGRDFNLTLIARRSRYYAGTRYLKRGVNKKGRVANDVETEQIVFEDTPEGCPAQISSVVQNRGSIPLFWSQETSSLIIKPDIIVTKEDQSYEATRTHFNNLVSRYENPVIILSLIKTHERKPRESKLRIEFANAIEIINQDLPEEKHLIFLPWDLQKHYLSQSTNVLALLGKVTEDALKLTGFFHSQVTPELRSEVSSRWPYSEINDAGNWSLVQDDNYFTKKNVENLEMRLGEGKVDANGKHFVKPLMLQKGVLRTNCIDCLDRTNVAQYAYGLAALGHQLHALGFIDIPEIGQDAPLADDLMQFYEIMGDKLAFQYGGSAAHNKIFSERRGEWKPAAKAHDIFKSLQRYYNNTYMDADKQDAINIFLGYFQPQQSKHEQCELDSDQHYGESSRLTDAIHVNDHSVRRERSLERSLSDGDIVCETETPVSTTNVGQTILSPSALLERTEEDSNYLLYDSAPEISICESDILFGRSLSDGDIVCETESPVSTTNVGQTELSTSALLERAEGENNCLLSKPTLEISICETDLPYGRYTPLRTRRQLLAETGNDEICFHEDVYNRSDYVEVDRLSSAGNSCVEELYERSSLMSTPVAGMPSEDVLDRITFETSASSEHGSDIKRIMDTEIWLSAQDSHAVGEFSKIFVQWIFASLPYSTASDSASRSKDAHRRRNMHREKQQLPAFFEHDIDKDGHICELPEDILSYILSFLTMRDAVKVRVLSRKWRYLCASTSTVVFDRFTIFGKDDNKYLLKNADDLWEGRFGFLNAVDQVMHLYRNPKIYSFKVSYGLGDESACHIDKWICSAIRLQVKNINLFFSAIPRGYELYKFPCHLLPQGKTSSLRTLYLRLCRLKPSPDYKNGFNSLKALVLDRVPLDQSTFDNILTGCLSLVSLSVRHCILPDFFYVYGGHLFHLKRLDLKHCLGQKRIELSFSNLSTFNYKGPMIILNFVEVSIKKVYIGISRESQQSVVNDMISGLVKDLPELHSLSLHVQVDQVQPTPANTTIFNYLKVLELFVRFTEDFDLLSVTSILNASPCVQRLILGLSGHALRGTVVKREYSKQLHYELKQVEIVGLLDGSKVMDLAIYLLNSAVALKRMVVTVGKSYVCNGEVYRYQNLGESEKERVLDVLSKEKCNPNAEVLLV